jgi:predicted RNA-binding Zn ribbon-like protein
VQTPNFQFLGNSPWLDFVDTELADGTRPVELLNSFEDLLRWARMANLVDKATALRIAETARDPAVKREILDEAHAFRAELRQAAIAIACGRHLKVTVTSLVNRLLQDHPVTLALEPQGSAWRVCAKTVHMGPRTILAKVAEDFARFVSASDLSRLRHCAHPACKIFFYDTSKNRTRRWCDMKICGNRAKAAQHRTRQAIRPS